MLPRSDAVVSDAERIPEEGPPPEMAVAQVVAFESRFGRKHHLLACHAALPALLTPALLNLIRINFLVEEQVPWIAEADLLLSHLCRPLEDGLYEVARSVREVLLVQLEDLYGSARLVEIAKLLLTYVDNKRTPAGRSDVARTLRWIGKAYTDPVEMVHQMIGVIEAGLSSSTEARHLRGPLQVATVLRLVAEPLERSSLRAEYQRLLRRAETLAQEVGSTDLVVGPTPVARGQGVPHADSSAGESGAIQKEARAEERDNGIADQFAFGQITTACACIETPLTRGTGYLVAPDRVATCASVIEAADEGGRIHLTFAASAHWGTVEKVDRRADWAIIKLDSPLAGVQPLRRAPKCSLGAKWVAYGFPAVAGHAGVLLEGKVQDPNAQDESGGNALRLCSADTGAGVGARLRGFSGSPVLVGEEVVGHIKGVTWDENVVEDEHERENAGLVFACPIADIDRYLSKIAPTSPREGSFQDPVPPPPGDPYNPSWYVHRHREEDSALLKIFHHTPVVLFGPQCIGKTTLLDYLLHRVRQIDLQEGRKSRVARIDLRGFDSTAKRSLDRFLHELATQIVDQIGGSREVVTTAWARLNPPSGKMTWVMERHVLQPGGDRLILAMSRLEDVRGYPFSEDFFGLLRAWAEEPNKAPWSQLQLLLDVSVTPARLTAQRGRLNVLSFIPVGDFSPTQVRELADLYNLSWGTREIYKLMALVGGNPFLLRQSMNQVATRGVSLDWILDHCDTEQSIFSEYLQHLWSRLEKRPELLEALRQVMNEPDSQLDDETYEALHMMGLVVQEKHGYRLRYRLYDRFFGRYR